MIPSTITREHILQAIKEVDVSGYPDKNESRMYDLLFNEKRYPPKIIISIANKFANGIPLEVSEFSGGEQPTNKFLSDRGFQIVLKDEAPLKKSVLSKITNGQKSYSWTILLDKTAIKQTDKSVFIYNETCLPKGIVKSFFSVDKISSGNGKIILHYDSREFEATIGMSPYGSHNTDLIWKKDFANIIRSKYPQWVEYFKTNKDKPKNSPIIRFKKQASIDEYEVELIDNQIPLQTGAVDKSNEILLTKYHEYSRKEVHDIFDRNSRFTLKSGTWGLRGIIAHPSIPDDFIFFVTFGRSDLGFTFQESITESGILTWQSEPKQQLKNPVIQRLIRHDHRKNTIYLFLRTGRNQKFSYLGRLAYITHDNEREAPVHVKWQILDWDIDESYAEKIGLKLISDHALTEEIPDNENRLIQTPPPEQKTVKPVIGEKSREFIAKKVDFAENEEKKRQIGIEGEDSVFNNEKKSLQYLGLTHLLNKIEHISKIQGDGAGYDIRSIMPNGETKYIEVKTTVGGINTPFNLTLTELLFSQNHADNYYLYRVYDLDRTTKSGKYFILKGDLSKKMTLEPILFNCKPQIKAPNNQYSFND